MSEATFGPGSGEAPSIGQNPGVTPGAEAPADAGVGAFNRSAAPTTPQEALQEALLSNYYDLEARLTTNPTPTQQELDMGVFAEEIQPQARDAVLRLRQNGYNVANVLGAGFGWEDHGQQQLELVAPLAPAQQSLLETNGFSVEENRVSFRPANPADLTATKETWDWLAAALPDQGAPAPPAPFGIATAFRDAAKAGMLLSAYMPNGQLNMMGVKNGPQPEYSAQSEFEQSLSPDPAAATRERALVGMYHELKARLANNPTPTQEEWNAGTYKEELEPQVRDAVMAMRQKGYNTGSSGFWGDGATEQVVDMDTRLDDATKAALAEHGIVATNKQIRFAPSDPTDLASAKETWDMIAGLLPDKGKPAEPSTTLGANMFRHAVRHNLYDDHLEGWLLEQGALDGYMQPLVTVLLQEGRDFGSDVYAASRQAKARQEEIRHEATRA